MNTRLSLSSLVNIRHAAAVQNFKTFGLAAWVLCVGMVMWGGVAWGQSLWNSSGSGGAWLTAGNWTPSGVPATSGYAQFQANPTSAGQVGINMNSGSTNNGSNNQAVGAIEVTGTRANALIIGNSTSSADGTLTLNGITVNSVANTILRNNTNQLFTIQQNISTATSALTVALGNATNNIINIDGTGGITISIPISGSTRNLTKGGSGTGKLTLSGANTFSGAFTTNTGTTDLLVNAALGSVSSVTINTGATLQSNALGLTNVISNSAGVTFNGTGKLDVSGGSETVASISSGSSTASLVIGDFSGSAGSFTVGDATSTLTFAGVISGSRATSGAIFTKQGTGILVLTGANTYTGSTTVSAGTLQLNRAGSGTLASTSNVTIAGGTLRISTDQTINNLTMTSGTLQVDAGVILTITGTYSASGGTVNNLGTIRLNGTTQSFPGSGVTVNNGTASTLTNLTIGSTGAVTLTGSFTVSGALSLFSGSLDLNGNTLTLNSGVAAQSIGGAGSNSFTISSTAANGVVSLTGSGSHTITLSNFGTSSGGGLIIGTNTTLRLDANAALSVGGNGTSTSMLTVNNRLLMNSATNSNIASGTAPFYGNASTLEYAADYGPFQEWLAGAALTTPGVPQNVTISAGTVTMPNTDRRVLGNLNITGGTLTLNGTSGDLYVAGNWTRASAATFNPNERAVFFNGTGIQVVTVSASGTETFNYLLIQGSSTLQLATNTSVVVNRSGGLTLNSTATNSIDLNGQTMTLSGGGFLSLGMGARGITSTVAGGSFVISTALTTVTTGSSLTFGSNVTVKLSNGFNPGAGLTTINGTLQINSGGFVSTNAPTYGASSLLQYNSGTNPYGRGAEWTTASSGAGYPANVQVSNNTTLDYPNGDNASSRFMASNLTVDAGSSFYMDYGTGLMTGSLTVGGSVNLNGNLSLGDGVGGDIKVGGDWSEGSAAVFTPNSRAVFLNGTGDQYIGRTGGTNTFAFLNIAKTGGAVNLINNITVNNVLSFDAGNTANIDPGGSTVIVSNNASGAVVRTGNGYVLGDLRRAIATGANTYLFPVGTTEGYTPVSLAFSSVGTGGNLTVNSNDANHPNFATYGLSATKYVSRHWNVTNSGVASFNVAATFNYLAGDLLGGALATSIKAAKYDASWTLPTTTTSGNSFTAAGLNSFSGFMGGEAVPDYTITTTGNAIVITDVSGIGEMLDVSESGSNINFNVSGRTYSLNGGAATAFPVNVPLAGVTAITINTAAGNDIINIGAFTATLPSLTVNGGTGDDAVNFNGDISFAANANLDLDLQNDDATPGDDAVAVASTANLRLFGTGTATVKVSKNVTVNSGGSIETVNGNLTVEANQQEPPTAGAFVGVDITGGQILCTGTGNVSVKGRGGDTGANQYGVLVSTAGSISGGSSGTTTVEGTGGPSTGFFNFNHGVFVSGDGFTSTITSSGGNVIVTGTGGGSGFASYGVTVQSSGRISAGGSGTTTVIGNGAPAAPSGSNYGVYLHGFNSIITSSGGNVSVTGTGGITGSSNYGVFVQSSAQISAAGTGMVTVVGNGGASAGSFNWGVHINSGGAKISSSFGDVSVTGTGGGSGAGMDNYGVYILDDGQIQTGGGSGTVTVVGQGGTSSGNNNYGVYARGGGTTITSWSGNVSVTGTGGGSGASGNNIGVYVLFSGQITAGGSGTVNVLGAGGTSTGGGNLGVHVESASTQIASSGGAVSVTGQGGGSGVSPNNTGVYVIGGGEITAGGSGAVTVQGTGGASMGDNNHGLLIGAANARISSSGGNVSVTGQGGGSALTNNGRGVWIQSSGEITAGGSGTVTVQGTGGASTGVNNYGVSILGTNARITSTSGPVTVTGVEGGSPNGIGFDCTSNGQVTTATNGGNIALIANSMRIESAVSTNASSSVTLRPYTNAVQIDLGSASNPIGGPLGLSDTELDLVTTGTLNIGDANTGDITVSADITRPASTNVQLLSGGDVTLSGGGFNTGGGTLLLDPGTSPAAVKPTFTGTDATASTLSFDSGSDLAIVINGTTAGTQYNQLNVAGVVNLTGVDLVLSGTHTPVVAQTFTIVDNDDTEAITGTFTGLAQGAYINNFLGSGLSAQISYTGGTGNDVVLTVVQADYTITTTGNAIIITDISGNGETLDVTESGGNIRFVVTPTTRTYSINGGAITAFTTPAEVLLVGANSITINPAAGNDIINLGAFTANLPSLTVNGGTGDDVVNFNGDLTFATDASLDVDLQNDDATPGDDAVNIAADANLVLYGTGAATVKVSRNVLINSGGSLETVNGNLTVEANQQATPTSGSFIGVDVEGGNIQTTGNGTLTVKGRGGDSGSGSGQFGVQATNGGKIEGGMGLVTVQGTGGASSSDNNFGVQVSGSNSRITSSGGNVSVTGTGGGSESGEGNFGVFVQSGGQITAGVSGTVTVVGNGGTAPIGSVNMGVFVRDANSKITSSGGNVSVTGTGGGSGSSDRNFGILVQNAGQITAGGSGTVTVVGNGGTAATGDSNSGVLVGGINSKITSSGGNVSVTGTGGGSGSSSSNLGILASAAGQITAGAGGTVTVSGQGGAAVGTSNFGVFLTNVGATITSSGGDVSVTGVEGGGPSGTGIVNQSTATIATSTNGGNITLIANSMSIGVGISTPTGNSVTLRPYTNGVPIDLGSGSDPIGGPLGLSDTELDLVTTGTLIIGNANSGTITVSADITRPASTNVQLNSGGDVTLSGGGFNTGGGTLLLDPGTSPAAVKPTFNDTDATASTLSFDSGSDLAIVIDGTTPGTQYNQLKVAGVVNLTGVDLVLSGSHTPVAPQTFTIVDNDGSDAITGTFTGLAEGAIIADFLGSGLDAVISYVGGTGNDVVINVSCPTITFTATPSNTCGSGSTGQIAITAPTGSVPPYMYSINNGANYQAGATFTSLAAATYVVKIKDANGCESAASSILVGTNTLPTAMISGDLTYCSGGTTLTASGGVSYLWENNSTDAVRSITSAGTYTVQVTAANGCTDTETATVTVVCTNPAEALDFDGANDYVSLNGTFGGPTWEALTVEAWVKVNATSGNFQSIISAPDRSFVHFQLNSIGQNIAYTDTPDGPSAVAFPIISQTPIGQWRHLAMVIKSGDSRFYVDGVQQGPAVTTTFTNILASSAVTLGRGFENGRLLNGQLDEVRIWNTARTCEEIYQLRNCELTGSEAGLVAYYQFNQGFAGAANPAVTDLLDVSNSGHDGTLQGFTLDGAASNWVAPGGVVSGTNCQPVEQLSVLIEADPGNTVCLGSEVTFTAFPVNAGATPSYQWLKNGNDVGDDSATYVDSDLEDGDVIAVIVTSSTSSCTAVSDEETMTVLELPDATFGTPLAAICPEQGVDLFLDVANYNGELFTLTYTVNGEIQPHIESGVMDGHTVSLTEGFDFTGDLTVTDIVVTVEDATGCSASLPDVTVVVQPVVATLVPVSATVCQGGTLTLDFTESTYPVGSTFAVNLVAQLNGFPNTLSFENLEKTDQIQLIEGIHFTGTSTITNITVVAEMAPFCFGDVTFIEVTVNEVTAGSIAADQTICSGGDPAAFTQSDATGFGTITYRWESSTTDCDTDFSPIGGATSAIYDVPAGLTQTTYYRRVAISTLTDVDTQMDVLCEAISNCVTVTVNSVMPGGIANDQTICSGGDPAAFTQTDASGSGTITYRWESSTTNCSTGFSPIGGETGSTYNVPAGLTQTTYYRRVAISTVNGVMCEAISNCATVTINSVTAGSIAADQTICSGGNPTAFTQTDATGSGPVTYRWESSTTDCTTGFSPIGATDATYDVPAGLTQTTYYRRVAISTLNGVMCEAASNCVTVTVNSVAPGSIAMDQVICSGDPAAFTEATPASGTALTYRWESSTTNCSTGFSTIGGAIASDYDAPAGLTQTTYYRRVAISTVNGVMCEATSNCVTVTFNSTPSFTSCPGAPVTANTGAGVCTAAVTYTVVAAGVPTPTLTYAFTGATTGSGSGTGSGSTFAKGSTNVVVTATNSCGMNTCSFTVTVADNQAPTAVCQNAALTLDGTGNATLAASDVNNGSTDNCGTVNLSVSPNTFNCTSFTPAATDLFFSEYVEGSSSNKYVEIFNPTSGSIVLSGYRLRLYSNGATSTTNDVLLSGTLASGATVVYKNSAAPLVAGAIDNAAVNYGGDDALALFKISTGQNVDIIGKIGEDPGTAWTGAGGYSTQDKTLRRKPTVFQGVTTNPASGFPTLTTEWNVFNIDDLAGLGSHQMAHRVTLTVNDGNGNSTTCTAVVTVQDASAPTLTCPSTVTATTSSNGTGDCTGSYTISDPVTDNCTGATWGYSGTGATTIAAVTSIADGTNSSSLNFTKGTTVVTLTASDAAGNAATTCTFNVVVTDNEAPTLSCPANQALTASGACTATYTIADPLTDNCTLTTWGYSASGATTIAAVTGVSDGSSSGSKTFNAGITTVVLTAVDAAGLAATTCAFTVTVTDSQAPTALCKTAAVVLDGTGNATLSASSVDNGSTDNCGSVSLSVSPSTFNCSNAVPPVPTDLFFSEYVEGSSNNKYIEIFNPTASAVNLAGYQLRLYANGDALNAPTITNALTGTLAAGATIVYKNTDAAAYTGTATVLTGVNWNGDDAIGLYKLSAAANVDIFGRIGNDPGTAWTLGGNTTVDKTLRRKATVYQGITTNPSGTGAGAFITLASEWDEFNTDDVTGLGSHTFTPLATATVTLTATDGNSLTGTCTAIVTIQDATAPTLTCPANQTVLTSSNGTGDCTGSYTFGDPLSDNCSGATWSAAFSGNANGNPTGLTNIADGTGSGSITYQRGTTTVTLTAKDASNNAATSCSFTVTLSDDEKPTLAGCPSNITLNANDDGGTDCLVLLNYTAPTYSDNCSGTGTATYVSGPASGTQVDAGASPYTVVYTYTDAAGNAVLTNCSFTVTVQDNVAPTLSGCPSNTTLYTNDDGGADCQVLLTYTAPTYSDNCAGTGTATLFSGPASNTMVNVAGSPYTVVYTYADPSNNPVATNCTFTVTVVDNTLPTLSGCPSNTTLYTNDDGGADCSVTLTYTAPTYSDNCAGTGTASLFSGPASGTPVNLAGSPYTVIYTYTDPSNNTVATNCTFTVTVVDNTLPTLSGCPSNTTLYTNDDGGADCSVTLTYTAPTYSDNCAGTGVATYVSGPASGTPVNVAGSPYTVVYTYTDPSSNTVSTNCSFTVTVVDNTLPTLAGCPSNTTLYTNDDGGADCAVLLTYTAPTYTDNCGGTGTATRLSGPASNTSVNVAGSPYTVVYTYTDPSSNTVTTNCSFTVTVVDNTLPTLAGCPSNRTVNTNDDGGADCAVTLTYTAPTYSDNCAGTGPATYVSGPASGTPVNVAGSPYTVVYTYTDPSSNTVTTNCSFTVTVVDNTAPSTPATCPGNQTIILNGSCQATMPDLRSGLTATDNCSSSGSITFVQSPAPGTTINGVTPVSVTIKAVDAAGNMSTVPCSFTVTGQTREINVTGNSQTIADGDATPSPADHTDFGNTSPGVPVVRTFSIQNTGTQPLTISSISSNNTTDFTVGALSPASPIPAGMSATFNVTFTAVLPTGLKNATITVNNNDCDEAIYDFAVSGSINCSFATFTACPGNQTAPTVLNQCAAVVNYTAAATGIPAPAISYTFTGATQSSGNGTGSGSAFNTGVTTVVLTATNACGSTTCSFTVTVNDGQNPMITCPANIVRNTDLNLCSAVVTYAAPTFTDNCPGVSIVRTGGQASGSVFPKGSNMVNWKATDAAGNTAICGFTVTVNDTQLPTIGCPANINKTTDPNLCTAVVNYTTPAMTDNCTPVGSVSLMSGPASGSVFSKGASIIVWKATDSAGLTKTCSFTVNVTDGQVPVITCPANQTKNTDANLCTAVVTYTLPTATDNCGSPSVAIQGGLASGTAFPKGLTTVIWRATDGAGLTGTCSFKVTVNDTQAPTITCPANQVKTTDPGVCTAVSTYLNATFTDNCPGGSVVKLNGVASGSSFPKGVNNVTFKATDASGNFSVCTMTITVNDAQLPSIVCPANIVVTGTVASGICSATVTYINPVGTDNCSGVTSFLQSGLASGSVYPVGTSTNVWRAVDLTGASSTCSFTVTVSCGTSPQGTMNDELGTMNEEAGTRNQERSSFIVHRLSFNLAPNPAVASVTVSMDGVGERGGTLLVFDAMGRLVLRQVVAAGQRTAEINVDSAEFATGLYQVSLRTETGAVTKPLVVSKL